MACWRTVAAQHAKASWESLAAQGRKSGNNTVPVIIKAEIDQDCWFTDDSNNQVGFCRVWCFGRTQTYDLHDNKSPSNKIIVAFKCNN